MRKILSTIMVVMMITVSLVGCGEADSPKVAIKTYLEEVKQGNNEDIKEMILTTIEEDVNPNGKEKILSEESFSKGVEKAMNDALGKIEYKIDEEKIDGDKATVSVSLNNVNFSNIFMQFFHKYMTEKLNMSFDGQEVSKEDLTKLFEDILVELMNTSEQETRKGDINLIKVDGKWTIDKDESFNELMLGKLIIQ